MQLTDQCAIAGVGNTAYTRGTERSTLDLHLEARGARSMTRVCARLMSTG